MLLPWRPSDSINAASSNIQEYGPGMNVGTMGAECGPDVYSQFVHGRYFMVARSHTELLQSPFLTFFFSCVCVSV